MKNKKFNKKNLFNNNSFVMVFSVIAAVILWLVVAVEFSPEVTVTVRQVPVSIDYTSISKSLGLEPFGETQFTVDVTVKGKKITVESDELIDDIKVTASTNYVNSVGNYNLHLTAESSSVTPDYEIVSLSDENVDVFFDYPKTKEFVVVPEIDHEGALVPDGYITSDIVFPETNVVKATGPESEINRIVNIVAYVSVENQLKQNTTLEATLLADTSDGQGLKFVTFDKQNDTIHMKVPVYKTVELPVAVDFINKPSDYVENIPFKVTVLPEKAVFGVPESKLDNMKSFEVASIDFTKLNNSNNVFTFSADEITGGIIADGTKEFTVKVELSDMGKKTFEIPSEIGIVNGSEGTDASVSELSFTEITVVGPKEYIEALTVDKIVLNADLVNVKAGSTGEFTVPVTYADSSSWLFGDYSAKIIIK